MLIRISVEQEVSLGNLIRRLVIEGLQISDPDCAQSIRNIRARRRLKGVR